MHRVAGATELERTCYRCRAKSVGELIGGHLGELGLHGGLGEPAALEWMIGEAASTSTSGIVAPSHSSPVDSELGEAGRTTRNARLAARSSARNRATSGILRGAGPYVTSGVDSVGPLGVSECPDGALYRKNMYKSCKFPV